MLEALEGSTGCAVLVPCRRTYSCTVSSPAREPVLVTVDVTFNPASLACSLSPRFNSAALASPLLIFAAPYSKVV